MQVEGQDFNINVSALTDPGPQFQSGWRILFEVDIHDTRYSMDVPSKHLMPKGVPAPDCETWHVGFGIAIVEACRDGNHNVPRAWMSVRYWLQTLTQIQTDEDRRSLHDH